MKRVVSVSIGSSRRDHAVEVELAGEKVRIERIGTDGDLNRAVALLQELDGQVDAFGMGGIDLYLVAGNRRYVLRDARRLAAALRCTPIVDGSGLKNTLERRVVQYLANKAGLLRPGMKVLLVSGVDRFGMGEALVEAGAEVIFGDFIFALGLPIPIRTLRTLKILAALLLPILSQLPFTLLYPTGSKQESTTPRYPQYYQWADVIAGDFHFIRKYMPPRLEGKIILTNTVTAEDVEELRRRGVSYLVTTTPELNGRSFGTNVMEAVLVSLSGKAPSQLTVEDYHYWLDRLGFAPRIEKLT